MINVEKNGGYTDITMIKGEFEEVLSITLDTPIKLVAIGMAMQQLDSELDYRDAACGNSRDFYEFSRETLLEWRDELNNLTFDEQCAVRVLIKKISEISELASII